ncbi:MAG: ABC transporter ATP-binding protein [Pseudomonadota bacterium]
MTTAFISCRGLSHGYSRGGQPVPVINKLDLKVQRGDFVALMGPSGSGKSTLLNLLGGLERPDAGELLVDGVNVGTLPESTLAHWRAQTLGFVFQFYNLIAVLSAQDNVALPLLLTDLKRRERQARSAAALELVGMTARARHKPAQLSGGQQQRVALARAIVADPALLVCDEPTGDLDRRSADEVLALLGELNQTLGKTIVMVTHDPRAATHASTVWHMDKGQLRPELEAAV